MITDNHRIKTFIKQAKALKKITNNAWIQSNISDDCLAKLAFEAGFVMGVDYASEPSYSAEAKMLNDKIIDTRILPNPWSKGNGIHDSNTGELPIY